MSSDWFYALSGATPLDFIIVVRRLFEIPLFKLTGILPYKTLLCYLFFLIHRKGFLSPFRIMMTEFLIIMILFAHRWQQDQEKSWLSLRLWSSMIRNSLSSHHINDNYYVFLVGFLYFVFQELHLDLQQFLVFSFCPYKC